MSSSKASTHVLPAMKKIQVENGEKMEDKEKHHASFMGI